VNDENIELEPLEPPLVGVAGPAVYVPPPPPAPIVIAYGVPGVTGCPEPVKKPPAPPPPPTCPPPPPPPPTTR
jgi:hypothetical protein